MSTTGQKLYDLSFLEQMDDKTFLIQVIELYLQDTEKDLEEMEQAFDAGVLDTVYKTAHKLKSSTGMLQANDLYAVLEQTEQAAKHGGPGNEIAALINNAKKQFDRLKTGLAEELKMLTNAA